MAKARRGGRRPRREPVRPLAIDQSGVSKSDGRWIVRPMSGSATLKPYRCPGCQQIIPAGAGHLVVWPELPSMLAASGVEERRHWHRTCWERRR